LDLPPASEAAMSTYSKAVEDGVWKDIVLDLDVRAMFPSGPRKYVRANLVPGSDLKTYDAGQLFVATADCGGTPAIGKLWVEYDVELFVPQTSPTTGSIFTPKTFFATNSNAQGFVTGAADFLKTNVVNLNGIGVAVDGTTAKFTPPAGTYLCFVDASYTDNNAENFTVIQGWAKNGSIIPNMTSKTFTTGLANQTVDISTSCVVTCNGTTDYLCVSATLTGAVGIIATVGQTVQIMIQAA